MRGNSLLVAALGLSAIAVAACGGASSATLGSDYGPNVQATRAPAGSAGDYGNGIPTNPGATPAKGAGSTAGTAGPVSYTHLRAHETRHDLVCRLLLEKQNKR